MNKISQRIKKRRIELGLSQEELAFKAGYKSRSSINKIENDARNLTQTKIKIIADALNTTPDYIMGWEEINKQYVSVRNFPLYSSISCGKGLFVEDNITEYISLPTTLLSLTKEYFAQLWLSQKEPSLELKTLTMYTNIVKNYLTPLNNIEVKNIETYHIQNIIDNNKEHARTCQLIKLTVKQILKMAVGTRLITYNPAEYVVIPKYRRKEKRLLTHFEDVLSNVSNFSDKRLSLVLLLKYGGLRKSEALALTVNDLNFKTRQITINKAVTYSHNQAVIKETKTKSGNRKIPMLNNVYDFFYQYVKTLNCEYIFYIFWRSQEQCRT